MVAKYHCFIYKDLKKKGMVNLNVFNSHWVEGFRYNFEKKRFLFWEVEKFLGKKFIVSIVGLRRTGKTTIMRQLIDKLIDEGVPRHSILAYSFDSPSELEEVMDEYVRVSGKSFGKDQIYLFLDEVQKLEDWQDKIKIFYDNYPKLKIVVSGSSSLSIRKKSESLAGRIMEFHLEPLSFREYLLFRGKEGMLERPAMFGRELQKLLESYLSRQFIEIIEEDAETARKYVDTLIRKIIFEDIPGVYPVEQPQVLLSVVQIVANNPGMLLDYKSLSNDLKVNEKTLSNYVEFLEQAYLLHKSYNYSKNRLTSEKKLKKAYLKTTSFCEFSDRNLPKIVENCIVTQTKTRFFWRKTHEVDCVTEDGTPVEVKYRDDIQQNELRGLEKFREVFKTKKGVVVTRGLDAKRMGTEFIPAWKFLLG